MQEHFLILYLTMQRYRDAQKNPNLMYSNKDIARKNEQKFDFWHTWFTQ